jgi:hypothetical protein
MSAATRVILLGASLIPYLALVSVDAWMHERARQVPRLEKALHTIAAVLFLGFCIAVFKDATRTALALLVAFAGCTAWDELGFHRHLDRRERRIHFAAYPAFAVFLLVWHWTETAA